MQDASGRDAPATVEGYRFWFEDQVRFVDLDPIGHCNNAAINGFFESSRIALFHELGITVSPTGFSIPIVRASINFRAELRYRTRVRIGTRIAKMGRTSATLCEGIFDDDGRCAADAEFVIVLFDLTRRQSSPWPDAVRQRALAYS